MARSRSLMIRLVTKQEQGDPAKRNQQTNWHEDHEIRGNESLGSNDDTASQTNRTTPPNTGINATRRRLRTPLPKLIFYLIWNSAPSHRNCEESTPTSNLIVLRKPIASVIVSC
jgi:hypothetical protein